jgi:hypothetical protein
VTLLTSRPPETVPDEEWALEPRLDSTLNQKNPDQPWPTPQLIQSVDRTFRLRNDSPDPIALKRNEHICQIRPVVAVSDTTLDLPQQISQPTTKNPLAQTTPQPAVIHVDPDSILPPDIVSEFNSLHDKFAPVFSPSIPKYNGFSGKIEASANMGTTLPPQRKGRLPHYNRDSLIDLQQKFDDLESQGVFAKPEDVNVVVEYLNMSFLVKKPNGGTRLVTSFGEVGHYAKPQPALMPNVDQVLRNIAGWKFIIVTDLRQAFYQIPLEHASMKYCGVSTPFKGVRVYTRSAMGMPGSETALEELLTRVFGEYSMQGWCERIADDLYIGGNTHQELLDHWELCLSTLRRNNLGLNASKTTIAPLSTTILGWVWKSGTLTASTHRMTALATVEPPKTVLALRSFVGAYKVLSRVPRGYAMLLDPLDKLTAGKQSRDPIKWDDSSLQAFTNAQEALSNCQTITMPIPTDKLCIVTDAPVTKGGGIAATLYIGRGDSLKLAGFYNAKLKPFQSRWLPCEVEALGITSAIQHFAPYITQSKHQAQVLTDSKPCVQAHHKLLRGEFSNSARLTTFLATVSRFNMDVNHIAGAANLPTDYVSRNPPSCPDSSCQVCKFVADTCDSVVRAVSMSDVTSGTARMPFTSRVAWQATQQECSDLRRTHAHLSQGTRPGKKATKVHDVKRYLREAVISNDGVLVVLENPPFQPRRERIVVRRSVLDGLVTAIHIRFNHPTPYQMKQLVTRYFFALDLDKALQRVYDSCHHCMSLKAVPPSLLMSSEEPPSTIGTSFALDIMRRYRQYVLVLRETVSSYTLTTFVNNEKHDTLRDAIIALCSEVTLHGDCLAHIRVDPGPGLVALKNDPLLKARSIQLIIGNPKNVNKNPVAERAIEELGLEILRVCPEGVTLSPVTLALATASMNTRIRGHGLSAREVWTQRDQITGEQLPLEDRQIILNQHFQRVHGHGASARSKSHGHKTSPSNIQIGDLVYISGDRDKTRGRDKYIVVDMCENICSLRKFTMEQFRSKLYDVKLTDCFPIRSNVLENRHHGIPPTVFPVHDSPRVLPSEIVTPPDSYVEAYDSPSPDILPIPPSYPVSHTLPQEIPIPPSDPVPNMLPPCIPAHAPTSTSISPPQVNDHPVQPSRPFRVRKPPAWHTEYEMG